MKQKRFKKGCVRKKQAELLLCSGSKITTINDDGEVKSFILASDVGIKLQNQARLYPTRYR